MPETAPTPHAPVEDSRFGSGTWFVVGFLVVFVGTMFLPANYYDGRGVYQTNVWQYYLLEIRWALFFSGTLGPKSGSSTDVLYTAVPHILLSALGGALGLASAWILRRVERKS